jgi:hypothetical protein
VPQFELSMMMAEEMSGFECPMVSDRFERKVCFEKTVTYETVSTTDDDSRHSDGLSETTQECDALSNDRLDELDDRDDVSGLRTPDPLDLMPFAHVPPAFSEQEIAEALARVAPVQQQPVMPTNAPCFMNMPAMPPMGVTPKCPPGAVMVPVPVALPQMLPMSNFQLPLPMAGALPPQQVAVPKGFKLVRIPEYFSKEQTEIKETQEMKETKATNPTALSDISDPAKTERKIFVGGLSPVTTEETLVEYFSKYGPVGDAKVVREGEKSKGFAFVQFLNAIPKEVLECQQHFIDQRRCGVGPAFNRVR